MDLHIQNKNIIHLKIFKKNDMRATYLVGLSPSLKFVSTLNSFDKVKISFGRIKNVGIDVKTLDPSCSRCFHAARVIESSRK